MTSEQLIDILTLQKHPNEGGFFRETYRSAATLAPAQLPPGYPSRRSLATAIYYLLTPASLSLMHRVVGDEIFHHYLGDAVEMLWLHPGGESEVLMLGGDLAAGQRPQVVVPGGVWQGSRLMSGGKHGFALLGTTMSPGFDYADYEHGRREALLALYPAREVEIRALTLA